MTNKQDKDISPATTDSTSKSRIGHWRRVAVMILSGGFIYPNVMTENDDIIKNDVGKEAMAKKQQSFCKPESTAPKCERRDVVYGV